MDSKCISIFWLNFESLTAVGVASDLVSKRKGCSQKVASRRHVTWDPDFSNISGHIQRQPGPTRVAPIQSIGCAMLFCFFPIPVVESQQRTVVSKKNYKRVTIVIGLSDAMWESPKQNRRTLVEPNQTFALTRALYQVYVKRLYLPEYMRMSHWLCCMYRYFSDTDRGPFFPGSWYLTIERQNFTGIAFSMPNICQEIAWACQIFKIWLRLRELTVELSSRSPYLLYPRSWPWEAFQIKAP